MVREKKVLVYTYSELSEKARDAARQDFAASEGYSWADDAMASIQALAKHFGGTMRNWSIDWFNSSYSSAEFSMPSLDESEIEELLGELGEYNPETLKGLGDCKLTGFCADEDAIDGFRQAWHDGERDLDGLMQSAFDSWLKAAQADCESYYSDEQFAEMCEANGYEFYENGDLA
jgi:hypothetical protein